MKRIVIIGGGLSGHLLLINLLEIQTTEETEIVIIEKEPLEKVGLAYSTDLDFHLLNVPAGNMSAFHDDKPHFVNWLVSNHYKYTHSSFVPRRLYRRYIINLLEDSVCNKPDKVKVVFVKDEAVDVDMEEKAVLLKGDRTLYFDTLVLAVGNFPPTHLDLANNHYRKSMNYSHSAWDHAIYEHLLQNDRVFIIGTGLTMVDTLGRLQASGHKGEIVALSRHGLLPAAHKSGDPYPAFQEELTSKTTVLDMFKVVRKHLCIAAHRGIDWRAVIDSMRAYTPEAWMALQETEKRVFMNHIRHLWDAARHRMPSECAMMMEELIAAKRIKIVAGRMESIMMRPDNGFYISYQEHGTKELRCIATEVIINCMGPAGNYNNIQNVLINHLLRKGILTTGPLSLGINCRQNGAIVDREGTVSDCLFTIGAPMKGVLWETTAVPEIRMQAHHLAQKIMPANLQNLIEDTYSSKASAHFR